MPLYEYQCGNCEYIFERTLKMVDYKMPESEPCPMCEITLVKQIHTKGNRMGDPIRLGHIKPHGDWQTFINKLSRSNPGSDFTTY